MAVHTLETVSSFERGLGSACTVLRIDGDDLLAGSQEGVLACWSVDSGNERWRIEMNGPISDLAVTDDRVYAAASSDLIALDTNTGDIIWSRPLEGASDFVQVEGEVIWAASSVYEIEISDYTESTVWMFDNEGSLQEQWTFSERAWYFGLHEDGGVLLGLGRPRCGLLRIQSGESALHRLLGESSPVTTGACGFEGRFLIGHSDGRVCVVTDSVEEPSEERSSPVRAICSSGQTWFSGHESGEIVSSRGWVDTALGAVESLAIGPSGSNGSGIWGSRWNGESGGVTVLQIADGTIILELGHYCRIRHLQSTGDNIALGDSNGRIHLIEGAVLPRRLSGIVEETDDNERRSRLMERLRRLRGT